MSFLPKDINLKDYEDTEIKEYSDYILDLNTMKFKSIGQTETECLKEWIRETLKIQRYKYSIFPFEYGNEIETLIGTETLSIKDKKYYIETYITECLMVNQYIKEVIFDTIEIGIKNVFCKIIIKTIYEENIEYEYNI